MFDSLTQWFQHVLGQYGLVAVFIGMIIESACIPLPSEIIMPLGGLLAGQGNFSLFSVALAGTFGNLVGGIFTYFLGKTGGRKFLIKYGHYFFISKEHIDKAERWFAKRGEITVFVSRMLPGVRTFISLPAGIAHMRFGRFAVYTLVGSFPWAWGLAYAGYLFGKKWDELSVYLHDMNFILWGIAALILLFYFRKRRKKHVQKKRAI